MISTILRSCLTVFVTMLTGVSFLYAAEKYVPTSRIIGAGNDGYASKQRMAVTIQQPKIHRWELRTAPAAFLVRWTTLDISYRLNKNWSTGPAAVLYNCETGGMFIPACYNGSAYGWTGNYYFTSADSNTWYLSAHAYKESYTSRTEANVSVQDRDGARADTVFGYQFASPYINTMIGAGPEIRSYNIHEYSEATYLAQAPRNYSETRILPFFEFKMGVTF